MRSFDDIKTFSPRRREKALIMEDMQAARSGKQVMSESEVEQSAGAGQQAAAAQAAQMQTGVAREMMGQPQFAGQAAKFNAEVAGQAADAAAASRANANMLNAQLTSARNMAARAALAARSQRRNDNIWKGVSAGIAVAQTAAPEGLPFGTKPVT
jgi:hypothetical protein